MDDETRAELVEWLEEADRLLADAIQALHDALHFADRMGGDEGERIYELGRRGALAYLRLGRRGVLAYLEMARNDDHQWLGGNNPTLADIIADACAERHEGATPDCLDWCTSLTPCPVCKDDPLAH